MNKVVGTACIVLAFMLGQAKERDDAGQIVGQFRPNISQVEVRKLIVGECELYVATGPINGAATSNPIPVSIATGKGCGGVK